MATTFKDFPYPSRWILCCTLCLALPFAGVASLQAQSGSPLVTYEAAAQTGLQRAWFAQIRVDRSRNRVYGWLLAGDQLFATTTGGTVHALDAATGDTLWSSRVGRANSPALGPAVHGNYVAVISGSELILLDRMDGHVVWSKLLGGAPAGGPALGSTYAYATLLNGRVEGHRLDDPVATTWFYQSPGRIFQPPAQTGKLLSWPNDRGHLYVAKTHKPRVIYRLETNAEISAASAALGDFLYVASTDGSLQCVEKPNGKQKWRISTGFPVNSAPAVIGDCVFVASEAPALQAVDADSGALLWATDGVAQFASVSQQRVYGMDGEGILLTMDRETGKIVGRLKLRFDTTAIVNDQTDRIFLVDNFGLVQCLHETGVDQPIRYRQEQREAEESSEDEPGSPFVTETSPNPAAQEELPPEADAGNSLDDFDLFE